MTEQVGFSLRGRKPDVLTCIANLSNDEVFTPPAFANQMLDSLAEAWAAANDGADIWKDATTRFLDPMTKSGVFLREIAKRLVGGLADQIPDLSERVDHILTKQIYGIATTQLTSLLSRRSLYCSKSANGEHSIAKSFTTSDGNIWFERVEHEWVKDRCRYCAASKRALDRGADFESHAYAFIHTDNINARIAELFGGDMHFDVIVGNPPYQLSDGGFGTSAAPIYHLFVEQAKALKPRFLTMVIPARWFAGGKGLDAFRSEMLKDAQLRSIDDYLLVGDVFPGVAIQGGILYFLWQAGSTGNCTVTTHYEGRTLSTAKRPLLEKGSDVFIRYNEAVPILKKIAKVEGASPGSVAVPQDKAFSRLVSARKPFGLDTTFEVRATRRKGDVVAYWNGGPGFRQGGKGWVARAAVSENEALIDKWKVFIGRAYGDRGGGGASRDAPRARCSGGPLSASLARSRRKPTLR